MAAANPSELAGLLAEIDQRSDALSDPEQLSADDVLDLITELVGFTQKATMAFLSVGHRKEAIDLYARLARTLKQAAEKMPEDQRYPVDSLANLWAITVESLGLAPEAVVPRAPAVPPHSSPRRGSTEAYQLFKRAVRLDQQQSKPALTAQTASKQRIFSGLNSEARYFVKPTGSLHADLAECKRPSKGPKSK